MKSYRLNRLFNAKSNRCFDVAMDHGFFNEYGFLSGIEDLGKAVQTVVTAAPDAVQLTVGQARHLQALPGKEKPALVLRTDVANVYGQDLPRSLFSRMIDAPLELGADIIKADPTDDVSVYHRVVQIAGGIPVLVRGGGKASDTEILQRTEQLIAQGAAGIVYGRNIIQHANPAGMTRALMSLVHEGATASQAARFLG